jgi:Protein of unknown function (DUF4238)
MKVCSWCAAKNTGDIMVAEPFRMLPPELARKVKLSGKKTRQHYVFRHYLSAWAVNGSLWVRRRGVPKVFPAATEKVAVERHFYKLQPVTEPDVQLIRLLLLERVPYYVKERCEVLIHNFTMPSLIKEVINPTNPNLKEISDWLDEHIINAEENIQCDMESQLMKGLDDMMNGKTDFYSDDDAAQEFIHAICFQYMRTKKLRAGIEALPFPPPVPGADMKRCSNLYMLISAMVVADTIYRRRKQFRIVLLDNTSKTPFIAGDQPIVNTHATFREGIEPERLEFFYPLSPTRAMAFVDVSTERPPVASEDEVERFNEMMVWHSHEQVFSDSREYLEGLPTDGTPTG